jgi:hypothetical protein
MKNEMKRNGKRREGGEERMVWKEKGGREGHSRSFIHSFIHS